MVEVINIMFKDSNKTYYFSPNGIKLHDNDKVIVNTERGMQLATVVGEIEKIEEKKLVSKLKDVLRKANSEDIKENEKNIRDSERALEKCRELVEKNKLEMKVIDASFTFDRSQLLFRFLSDNRVDFRVLAKDLAAIYRTRIELRQVGVRDKAKEVGGIGPCGREFCCAKFLNDFDSVSINMAKNQSIALNPSKINGVCGRLLCCLKYEDENYRESKKKLPAVGAKVKINEGEGSVVSVDVLNEKYIVYIQDLGPIEVKVND